jgi:stage III sporulation protein AH
MTKKKKIFIMSTLVLLLAVTAVLNVLLVSNNTDVSADTVATANYFTSYRTERTSTRSEELLQLDNVIETCKDDTERYNEALDLKMKIVNIMEDELVLETMIKSLGFSDAVVSIGIDSENVNVFINSDDLNMDTALSIYNLLRNEAGVSPTNIIIMPVYSQI